MNPNKKRAKDGSNVVVAGSSKSSSESAFIGQPIYVNRLPDLPCQAKMLKVPLNPHRFTAYRPSLLEQRYHYEVHKEADLAFDFDLVDAMAWESPWARLNLMQPVKRLVKPAGDSQSDSGPTLSYEDYLKKKKTEIRSIQNEAKQRGLVAAPDSTLPLDKQLALIPKEQQEICYSFKVLPATASTRIAPVAGTVPWLKRTEYISGDRDLSRINTIPNISSLLINEEPDLDEDAQDIGMLNLGIKTDKNVSALNSYITVTEEDVKQAIGDIEASFETIENRSALVHPARENKQDLHVVEEWDVFPDETLWPTNYVGMQLDVGEADLWKTLVPELADRSGDAHHSDADQAPKLPILLPMRVNPNSLLTWNSSITARYALGECGARPRVSKTKPELLALLIPSTDKTSNESEKSTNYDRARFYQVEAEDLTPDFESTGSYVFSMSSTTAGDEQCDGDAERRVKTGIASIKNVDTHLILKKPCLKDRQKNQF